MTLFEKSRRINDLRQRHKDAIRAIPAVTQCPSASSGSSQLSHYRLGFKDGQSGKISVSYISTVYLLGRANGRRAWMKSLLIAMTSPKSSRYSGDTWTAKLNEMRLTRPFPTDEEIKEELAKRQRDDERRIKRQQAFLSVLRSQA